MRSFSLMLLSLVAVLSLSSCDNGDDKPVTDDCVTSSGLGHGEIIPDRYIISIPDDGESDGGRKSLKAVTLLKRNNLSEERILNHFKGKNSNYVLNITKSEAEALAADKEIIMIEPDRKVSMCACFTVVEPRLVTWNVDQVGYDNGIDETAWVLDTGADLDHPDLTIDAQRSRSFLAEFPTAEDGNGHGTHIAGIIGAKNNSIGTLGVASGATIVALKVLDDDGNGTVSAVLDALAFVNQQGKAGQVVNISLTVEDMSDILDTEIQALAGKGLYISLAAGNDQTEASKFSPARANGTNIYTVSAVDSLGRFASFSNYGNDAVDFAAPGVRILSTYAQGKYAYMNGTSMAAPHVAGILLINNGKVNFRGEAANDPDGVKDPIAHK